LARGRIEEWSVGVMEWWNDGRMKYRSDGAVEYWKSGRTENDQRTKEAWKDGMGWLD